MKHNIDRWRSAAGRRRVVLFALVFGQTFIASQYMREILPQHGETALEVGIMILFAALFAWISLGFWTALTGFLVLLFRRDRFSIAASLDDDGTESSLPLAKTAIVMPVYNEDVARVFAGLRATYRSLKATGKLEHFDFFVLSDSNRPDTWVSEERAWSEWCRDEQDFEHIHYRRRRHNIKRKTGNIADFCRRWGANYRYMVVLDADSVMAGRTLLRLVQLMERRHEVGVIQTAPLTINRETLYARVHQFANHVYGPLFATGLSFWQLGDGHYWGHNAIIRLAPFTEHCSLPRLPGAKPLGGEILSHDFVEAAYLRRAGWEVWLAYDLDGSYEEMPPTLLDELKRDQRWSQGNLQHVRLFLDPGFRFIHRIMFLYGVMAYASSLLWFVLLLLTTAEMTVQSLTEPVYFSDQPSLFPTWPVWHPEWALALLGSTALLLFLPKFLGALLVTTRNNQRPQYGGIVSVMLSVFLEILISILLAPVRMLFHSRYIVLTLLGGSVRWEAQRRDDAAIAWGEAIRHHGFGAVLAFTWAAAMYWINPSYWWWMFPVLGALILAVPVSVYTSRRSLGRFARRLGLFLIPAETQPSEELRDLDAMSSQLQAAAPPAQQDGFTLAVVDPRVNALHLALLPQRSTQPPKTAARLAQLRERALTAGPCELTREEKLKLLQDADSLAALHAELWQTSDPVITAKWGLTGAP